MVCKIYSNIDSFMKDAQPEFMKNEVENSLILGFCLNISKNKERYKSPFLSVVFDNKKIISIAVCVKQYKVLIYSSVNNPKRSFELIATKLYKWEKDLPGVIALSDHSYKFAQVYKKTAKVKIAKGDSQKLYKLNKVISNIPPVGKMRFAVKTDLALACDWMHKFHNETTPDDHLPALEQFMMQKIKDQQIAFWEHKKSVSMIFASRPTINGISINMVYTPKSFREQGFASALVANFSQHLLDHGWRFCTLFTDISNPISNSIYQKIGFKPMCDFQEYIFGEIR